MIFQVTSAWIQIVSIDDDNVALLTCGHRQRLFGPDFDPEIHDGYALVRCARCEEILAEQLESNA